jgi:hypothetical protein
MAVRGVEAEAEVHLHSSTMENGARARDVSVEQAANELIKIFRMSSRISKEINE